MSARHPIIAVTGSSGAGTTSVRKIFEDLFQREGVGAAYVEGDSFHRYTRDEMHRAIDHGKHVAVQVEQTDHARRRGGERSHRCHGQDALDRGLRQREALLTDVASGHPITSVAQAHAGQPVRAALADGEVDLKVLAPAVQNRP